MNTLPSAIKTRFFASKEEYLAFRAHWSALVNSERRRELSAAHYVLYAALRGRDWRKGFAFIVNQRKLDNGAFPNWGLFRALRDVTGRFHVEPLLAPFDGLVTPEMVVELSELLPKVVAHKLSPADFSGGRFPFDAYQLSEELAGADEGG